MLGHIVTWYLIGIIQVICVCVCALVCIYMYICMSMSMYICVYIFNLSRYVIFKSNFEIVHLSSDS